MRFTLSRSWEQTEDSLTSYATFFNRLRRQHLWASSHLTIYNLAREGYKIQQKGMSAYLTAEKRCPIPQHKREYWNLGWGNIILWNDSEDWARHLEEAVPNIGMMKEKIFPLPKKMHLTRQLLEMQTYTWVWYWNLAKRIMLNFHKGSPCVSVSSHCSWVWMAPGKICCAFKA